MNPNELIEQELKEQALPRKERPDPEVLKTAELQKQRALEEAHAGWLEQTITKDKIKRIKSFSSQSIQQAISEANGKTGDLEFMRVCLVRAYCYNNIIEELLSK